MKPILYIVAGPIGNLGDLTVRALDVLKNSDLIVAEDTRVTRKLLDHYGINKHIKSLRERSSITVIADLIDGMSRNNQSVAYLTDAGTPNIADPGGRLVAAARSAGITVAPLPGPSAATALMQVAGINLNDGVLFLGFLPKKKGRQTLLQRLKRDPWPVIIFEDKHRVIRTLNDFASIWGEEAQVVVGRELTKKFEEILSGNIKTIIEQLSEGVLKGEFTILIKP